MRQQGSGAQDHLLQHRQITLGAIGGVEQVGKVMADGEIRQLLQFSLTPQSGEMLKMTKPQETGRHTCHHRSGFKFFTQDLVGGCDDGQSTGSGYAQTMHGFAA